MNSYNFEKKFNMNTLNTIKIFEAFDELCVLLENLKRTGNLSLIEKDITLEKLRQMYVLVNKLESFDNIHGPSPVKKEVPPTAEPEKQSNVVPPTHPELNQEKEDVAEVETNTGKEEPLSISEEQNQGTAEKKKSNTVGDKYQGSRNFMNEHISANHPSKDISGKLQSKKVDDIGKAIGLNDKFLYINELFNGDSVLYKQTIESLNNTDDLDTAISMLQTKFNWDRDDENALKFMDIVKRKFL